MRPRTLFGRTAATLALGLLLFQIATLGAIGYYILVPVGQQSAEDLAALMVLSAHTLQSLPPEARPLFEDHLSEQHRIWLASPEAPLPGAASQLPYARFLSEALTRYSGREVVVRASDEAGEWFWVDVPGPHAEVRMGFPRERIGARPPAAIAPLLLAAALLVLVSTLLLVRRVTRPVAELSAAAAQLGRGEAPEALPETGPEELAALARSFNRMARQVHELLANRTTLLAGVSHDLRTPLARLRLALEMLPPDADAELTAGMARDIAEMDHLIGAFLEFSRGLAEEPLQETDLTAWIGALVEDARRGGAQVQWHGAAAPCPRPLRRLALRRVLTNLLDNAVRYGADRPVEVTLACAPEAVVVTVCDRGPGIPAAEREAVFRPFYRLEHSRGARTGGTGLGLAVARQLADANGWRIEILDRSGGGTEARVVL
jgi:two-component system, OmpR family, osmolarity sensor histidine kinase EnvZ